MVALRGARTDARARSKGHVRGRLLGVERLGVALWAKHIWVGPIGRIPLLQVEVDKQPCLPSPTPSYQFSYPCQDEGCARAFS
jgi:hypothetical protein